MTLGFRSWLVPPTASAGPKATLEFVRRIEIVGGLASLAYAVMLWNEGWWRWVLIGIGLFGLSPWPGARQILRRAQRDPGALITDEARRRRRGRRALVILGVLYTLGGAVGGYVAGGWTGAAVGGVMGVGSSALGTWGFLRWEKT